MRTLIPCGITNSAYLPRGKACRKQEHLLRRISLVGPNHPLYGDKELKAAPIMSCSDYDGARVPIGVRCMYPRQATRLAMMSSVYLPRAASVPLGKARSSAANATQCSARPPVSRLRFRVAPGLEAPAIGLASARQQPRASGLPRSTGTPTRRC